MPKKDDDPLTAGIILVAIGVILLLNTYANWVLWPLFIALPGVITLTVYLRDPKTNAGAIIPTTILFIIAGLFMAFTTGVLKWGDLTWLWPVFVMAPGLGLLFYSILSGERDALIPAGVLLTVALVFLTTASFNVWQYWPVIIIVIGLIVIITGRRRK